MWYLRCILGRHPEVNKDYFPNYLGKFLPLRMRMGQAHEDRAPLLLPTVNSVVNQNQEPPVKGQLI